MGLESIVVVNISRDTAAVTQAGFGVPLIIGPNGAFSGVREYATIAAVLADFATSTDEYKAAAKALGQTPRPVKIKIGKALTKVAQVATLTPDVTVQAIAAFTATINGTLFSFTSDASPTAAEVVTGLIALINAGAEPVTASGTSTLILTADVPGESFTLTSSANMPSVATTANVGIGETLAALSEIDDDWYALISTFKSDVDVLATAAYIEATKKIYGVSRSDAGILLLATTNDIFSQLQDANYFRTFTFYSADSANFPEAGLLGRVLPLDPGSETWAFKTIAGITIDNLTSSQIAACVDKNVNYYTRLAGVSIVRDGKTAGGEYIDVIRLVDWIAARMQETIYGSLVRSAKIPFTDAGGTVIQSGIDSPLKAAQKVGGIAPDAVDTDTGELVPGYIVSVPKVKDISVNDRAQRKFTGCTFSAKLAGAIHAVTINGNVTV